MMALSMAPGIGHVGAKKLIEKFGSAKMVFEEKADLLNKLNRFKSKQKKDLSPPQLLELAAKELEFAEKREISVLSIQHKDYPQRLRHCQDGPLVLYFKGDANLNPQKSISIVGSRKATIRSKQFCEKLIEELAQHQPTIISGLAFGVDICAHQAAIEMDLPTLAVMGMPLNTIYPPPHRKYAERILENGGWISDYHSNAPMIPSNFAERNRIVAGMSDATVVIESGRKGGSMITAGLAVDYNRDVFAVPGRPDDELSAGCNHLIKSQQAALIDSAKDIEYVLNWEKRKSQSVNQTSLFQDLQPEEKDLLKLFVGHTPRPIDEISLEAGIPMSKTATLLLGLELKGVVLSLPGKLYQLN